jgi:hypothetical protein
MTLVFEKNANFFAENWGKWQKIVIITSTPGYFWHYVAILNSKFPNAKFSTVTLPNFKSWNGQIF